LNRYTLLFLLTLAAAVLVNEANHRLLFPAVMTLLAWSDRRSLRLLLRWKLWLLLALLILVPSLLVGNKDQVWLGMPYNSSMFRLNLLMVERSLIIMLSVRMFTNHLSPDVLSHTLVRMRLHRFNRIFHLALALLPDIRVLVMNSLQNLDWRRLHRRGHLLSLLSQLIARIIHQAGKISIMQND